MRSFVYAIAVIAAVVIIVAIARMPNQDAGDVKTGPASALVSTEVMETAGDLTLAVPEMSCTKSCYPKVKKTLEETPGVESIELAAQKEEGLIDNRQVIVHYQPGFNVSAAIANLEKSGYPKSSVAE